MTSLVRSDKNAASASGPSPSFTGAPSESNCTACHSTFEANSGTGRVVITGLPKNYLPGQQIPLRVTTNDTSGVLFGFQMTSVEQDGDRAGTFIVPPPSPVPIMQVVNGFVGNQNRQYIEHTVQGITPTVAGTKSWDFTWTAPPRRVGKVNFFAAGNAANSDGGSDNDQIYTTSVSSLSGSAVASFDEDGKSDFSVFHPPNSTWYSISSDGTGEKHVTFGVPGDIPVPGDYDGDGITDHAVFRPADGFWFFLLSSNGDYFGFQWGVGTDIPVAGDFDGDGRTNVAVFRPSNGTWYILNGSGGLTATPWGQATDIPVRGDFDGDAKTDLAVYRPSTGSWYILQSLDGFTAVQFGLPSDQPKVADYDGDGRHDIAVFRPASGQWWILRSSEGLIGIEWGSADDILAPGDFDGDGKADLAVFRPSTGFWYAFRSSDLGVSIVHYGLTGDIPVPTAY
ncbi:MAG: choice-of-anchor V domain-containing protein [Pyrinomonadaceae bacterium]